MNTYDSLPDDLRFYAQKPLDESHLGGRDYTMRITKEMEHSRGVAWTANLYLVGKLFAVVENMGNGGCNDYVVKNEDLWDTFCEDAYLAYGNRGESKDALVQLIDLISSVSV